MASQTAQHPPTPRPAMTAHVEGMTDVERLLAIEEIKQLKARYFRCIDIKDWEGWEAVFAPDVEFDLREGILARDPHTGEINRSGEVQITEDQIKDEEWMARGAANVRDWEQSKVDYITTIHHGHCPEIEILTPTTAQGIWHSEYILRFPLQHVAEGIWWLPTPSKHYELRAFGLYYETYERIDERWLIKTMELKNVRAEIL